MWNFFKHTFDDEICDDFYLLRLRLKHLEEHRDAMRKEIQQNRRERGLI